MKVLITGAGGNLGRVLAPALAESGYEPILMDYRQIETPYRFIKGDIRNKEDVFSAVKEADIIVHAAALHGICLDIADDYTFMDEDLIEVLKSRVAEYIDVPVPE